MNVNRKFKSSVFTTLFENPDLLRELYCALEGVSLPPDTPVSMPPFGRQALRKFI